MILHSKAKRLKLVPIDVLFIASTLYIGTGIYYGLMVLDKVYMETIYSFLACTLGFVLFRKRAINNALWLDSIEISAAGKEKLVLIGIIGTVSMLVAQGFVDQYFYSTDKINRSETISSSFFLRIPFYAALFICFCLYCSKDKTYEKGRFVLFALIAFVTLIDMNREFLIAFGLIVLVRHFNINNKNLLPSGFLGFLIIILLAIFVLLAAKPLYYLVVLGSAYDGGFSNYGEAVNWYRWLDFANSRQIDLSIVQRNDFLYSLESLIFPFSSSDSASKIWFNEILGYQDVGRTFGYSGVLWLSYYFKGPTIIFPWLLIFWAYSGSFFRNNPILNILIVFSLTLICYRFFRSEWPLVLKTFLWTFLYPGLLFIIISNMVINKKIAPFVPPKNI